jgi:hypothetical protein
MPHEGKFYVELSEGEGDNKILARLALREMSAIFLHLPSFVGIPFLYWGLFDAL